MSLLNRRNTPGDMLTLVEEGDFRRIKEGIGKTSEVNHVAPVYGSISIFRSKTTLNYLKVI